MMQRAIPTCKLVLLDSVGHGVNVVAAERCARATLDFLGFHFRAIEQNGENDYDSKKVLYIDDTPHTNDH